MYRLTMKSVLLLAVMFAIAANCYPVERTEPQRYYDLGISYMKSDLYEKGLDTLNQVAFLYPDSNVADDALYQLALIREQVGDGRINIGQAQKLITVNEELNRLKLGTVQREPWITLNAALVAATAQLKGEAVFDAATESAIAQYVLALDYLNTLSGRYPDSDRLEESKMAFERITMKISSVMPKPEPPPRPVNKKRDLIIIGIGFGGVIAIGMLAIALSKMFGYEQ